MSCILTILLLKHKCISMQPCPLWIHCFKFNFFTAANNSDIIGSLYTWVTWQQPFEATPNHDQEENHNFLWEICSSTALITNWKSPLFVLLDCIAKGSLFNSVMKIFLWYYWNILNTFRCRKLSSVEGLYQSSCLVISLFPHIERADNYLVLWLPPRFSVLIFYC